MNSAQSAPPWLTWPGAFEDELTYPGQIRVTVIRESRAIEFAR